MGQEVGCVSAAEKDGPGAVEKNVGKTPVTADPEGVDVDVPEVQPRALRAIAASNAKSSATVFTPPSPKNEESDHPSAFWGTGSAGSRASSPLKSGVSPKAAAAPPLEKKEVVVAPAPAPAAAPAPAPAAAPKPAPKPAPEERGVNTDTPVLVEAGTCTEAWDVFIASNTDARAKAGAINYAEDDGPRQRAEEMMHKWRTEWELKQRAEAELVASKEAPLREEIERLLNESQAQKFELQSQHAVVLRLEMDQKGREAEAARLRVSHAATMKARVSRGR
jgi:hypothetical protein